MVMCWVSSPVHLLVRIGSVVHPVLFLSRGAAMIYSLVVVVIVQPRDFIPPLTVFPCGGAACRTYTSGMINCRPNQSLQH